MSPEEAQSCRASLFLEAWRSEATMPMELTWPIALLVVVFVLDLVFLGLVANELRERHGGRAGRSPQKTGVGERFRRALRRIPRRLPAARSPKPVPGRDIVAFANITELRPSRAAPDVFERALSAVLPLEVAAGLCIWTGIGFALCFGYLS